MMPVVKVGDLVGQRDSGEVPIAILDFLSYDFRSLTQIIDVTLLLCILKPKFRIQQCTCPISHIAPVP